MILSGISFVCVNGGVHHLGTALPSAESAFIRFLMGLVLLMPALVATLRTGLPRGALPLVGLRGVLHTLAVLFWFYAMARIPVAEVTAIGYLAYRGDGGRGALSGRAAGLPAHRRDWRGTGGGANRAAAGPA